MSQFLKSQTRALSCIILLLITSHSQAYQLDSQKLENYLDSINSDGIVVLVAQHNKVIFSKAYGMADSENNIQNTTTTKFQIGSITKQFTSMGIMILKERGLINLSDPLSKVMDDIPEIWKPITIHQLLTHTSGLMHAWQLPDLLEKGDSPKTLDQVLSYFKNKPLQARPEEKFHYSGLGYFLLAKVIEIKSGQPWTDFIQNEIFNKLGMTNSGAGKDNAQLAGLAKGYAKINNRIQEVPYFYMPLLRGGGDIYSTTEDLLKWDNALRDGKLISYESYTLIYTPEKNNYGYGWSINTHLGKSRIAHSGSVPGFNALNTRYPEIDLVVIALTNVTGPQGYGRTLRSFTNFVVQNLDK